MIRPLQNRAIFAIIEKKAGEGINMDRNADYLGKTVRVVVDRPVGYQHGDITYPVNYGYVPGLPAGDGEEQDAYILGIQEPLREFEGQVIAIIHREDDCEDKFVVAPAGSRYHQGQIAQAVHFVEQYFSTRVECLFRKSCGVIPVRLRGGRKEFLILLQTNSCWSFPKGHMEAGETEAQTALRELREETGLEGRILSGHQAVIEYALSPQVRKQVVFFLGLVEGEVNLQEREVVSYKWVALEELSQYLYPDTYAACLPLLELDFS